MTTVSAKSPLFFLEPVDIMLFGKKTKLWGLRPQTFIGGEDPPHNPRNDFPFF
ncbi:MAG: hypothetical protein HW380_2326 [Magnetococcales bacterium]|nr:hypothetical protein [Magnetococcales bacterium]